MRYNEVSIKTWVSADFRKLTDKGKMLWLYLLTGPIRQQVPGIYRAGLGTCTDDLAWDLKDIKTSFKELLDAGMVQRDADTNVLYLPNWPKYNRPPANPNVLKSWLNLLDGIPDCTLKTNYIAELREVIESAENPDASLDVYLLWVKPLKPVKSPKKRPKQVSASVSDELTELSKYYHTQVKLLFPNLSIFKNGGMPNLIKYGASELEKLIRIDNHSIKNIKDILEWVVQSYDERQDFNWLPNCQSLRTIRKRSKNGNPKYDNISNDYIVQKAQGNTEKNIDYSDVEPF